MATRADTTKHTLHLREGDFDYLSTIYRPQGVSTSLVIRKIVSAFVDSKRSQDCSTSSDPIEVDIQL